MKQSWLIIEREENWLVDKSRKFSSFGLSIRYQTAARSIKEGDLIFGYVSSGISCFSDMRLAKSDGVRPGRREMDYDTSFQLYVETKPLLILPTACWLPVRSIAEELELLRGRRDWRQMFRTSLRRLTEADSKFLRTALQRRRPRE